MGNFHDEGGSAGTSTTPVAGSGGEPAPSRGSAGQPQGGQPTAGTGGSTTEPDPFPSCGDGVCSQTDYGIEGGAYVRPNTAACNADCPQSCGNAKCDALHDLWNGCYEAECVAKPPEPIVLCPFPEWESPYLDTFVNPYYPNVPHVKWTVGDRVRRGNYCYRCTDYECQEAPPSLIMGEPWQPIGCEC